MLLLACILAIDFVAWAWLPPVPNSFEYCAPQIGEAAYTEQKPERITATASWYDTSHCLGCHPLRIMRNGDRLNNLAMTAAYNDAPLGSRLLIRNGDKEIIVEVTDMLGRNRIDLTRTAFEKLGNLDDGLLEVEIIKL